MPFEILNLEDQVMELGIKDGVSKWGASVHWHDHIADVQFGSGRSIMALPAT